MKLMATILACVLIISCNKESSDESAIFNGVLSKEMVRGINGFGETQSSLLSQAGVSLPNFIKWSVDSAWSLGIDERSSLKKLRESIASPTENTLIQKIIPLEDVATYMNNTYGGTVGGFICNAADVKELSTMPDVYQGFRLDYTGTKFKSDGAGYGVIRFYSEAVSKLTIPFCAEMGGTQAHQWPNTGGGFTASTLGSGGYPEYTFTGYSAPKVGAELYEVTPEGREILRSVYRDEGGWQTNEIGALSPSKSLGVIRNGVFSDTKSGGKVFITTYAIYKGNRYIVRGIVNDEYHLTTTVAYRGVKLEMVEKGIYGINAPVADVEKIWEESEKLNQIKPN